MPSTAFTEVFVTLLHRDPKNPGFTVEESKDGNTLTIKPDVNIDYKAFLADIQKAFKSHADTAVHIPFRLNTASQQARMQFPQIQYPLLSLSELKSLDVTKILEKLFGKAALENIGHQLKWETVTTTSGQVIYRTPCAKKDFYLRDAQIKKYKYILSHASWDNLYLALSSSNSHYIKDTTSDDSEILGSGPLSQHLEQLFFIREENGKKVIYIDFEGLIKCIVAPQFDDLLLQESSSSFEPSVITVDKTHFMLYMSTILKQSQGILLHEHQEQQLLPISIACRNAIQSKTLIDFVIDCSGSMQNVFTQLKSLLKELINKMHSDNSLDKYATSIRVSRFGSKGSNFPIITLPLTEIGELQRTIDEFEQPKQQTAIYQFMQKQHGFYKSLSEDYNIVSILITDGQDNDSEEMYKPNASKTDELSKAMDSLAKQTNPPQYFSIEIGENIDEMVLEIIKLATNGTRIKAGNNLEDFKLIFDHLGHMSLYRNFMYFAQEARKFKLPVIEGSTVISSKDNYLDPNKPFTINGVSCTASTANEHELSHQNILTSTTETQTEEDDLQEVTPETSLQGSPMVTFMSSRAIENSATLRQPQEQFCDKKENNKPSVAALPY